MRVLMLSWEFPPRYDGGLGQHVAELARALVRQGLSVHVVSPNFHGTPGDVVGPEQVHGVHVHRVSVRQPAEFDFNAGVMAANEAMYAYTEKVAEAEKVDILHAHDWLLAPLAIRIKHKIRQPLIATIHATERGRARGGLLSHIAERIHDHEWRLTYEAWRIIACSRYMADQVRAYFNVPADKVDIIPNGVRVARFAAYRRQDLTDFRVRFALPDERIVFSVGRLVEEKGFHHLVSAIPLVLAEFPEAKFVIAGKGPMLPRLIAQAKTLGVRQKVLFTGFIPDEDRDRLFLIADLAVFPSLYEPFGIVVLEAMAAGCPVIVSEVGGLREVVTHEVTGVTVYPNDVDSLAWGILYGLRYPDLTGIWARNARHLAEEVYHWDHVARRTIAVYERVLNERREVVW